MNARKFKKGKLVPIIGRRLGEISRVDDKQTVILSGLRNTRKEKTVSKIPILGSIPILGYLFKSTTTKDLVEEFVVVITPHLVYNGADAEDAVKKTNDNMSPELKNELDPDANIVDPKKKKQK
jgi:type II secretory pathway component GspD/PulD (secretin)